jgi:hypothetical protein
VSEAAAFVAWLGAAVIVLSDGRRGMALGLALVAAGLAGVAWGSAGWSALLLLAGGWAAAALRLRSGPPLWGLMPSGSTPRLLLAVVAGLLALWVAASVSIGPGGPLRFASLALLGLMGATVLQAREPAVAATAAAGLALAVGAAAAIAPAGDFLPFLVAGLIACGISFLPTAERHAA